MSQINKLIKQLNIVSDLADSAHKVRNDRGQSTGLIGEVESTRINGEIEIDTPNHINDLSNHKKLTVVNAIEKLRVELKVTLVMIEAIFEQRNISYKYIAHSGKHLLKLDNQTVLEAVAKTWKQQIPLIQRMFHSDQPQHLWLVDIYCNQKSSFSAQELVRAPDLASAHIQHRFSRMTFAERKSKDRPSGSIFAAAKLTLAHDTNETKVKSFDEAEVGLLWGDFLTYLNALRLGQVSSLEISVNAGPDIDTKITQKLDVHTLMHEDDVKKDQNTRDKIVKCYEAFAARMKEAAPSTTFTLLDDIHMGRASQPKVVIGTGRSNNAADVVQDFKASEATGYAPRKLFVVRRDNRVNVVEARTIDEALDNVPYNSFGTAGPKIVEVYIAEPLKSDAIAQDMQNLQNQWTARHTKTRR